MIDFKLSFVKIYYREKTAAFYAAIKTTGFIMILEEQI